MPIDPPSAIVDVVTANHLYRGQVTTGGRRLADVLSDSSRATVEMHDVVVRSPGEQSEDRHGHHLILSKKDILLVVPQGRYEAPIRRHNNYQLKQPYPVMVVLPGYVVIAVAHLPPRANPWMLIDDSAGLPAFFGLTEVTVQSSPHGFVPSQCETVIVHRRRIEAVELCQEPAGKPPLELAAGTPASGD